MDDDTCCSSVQTSEEWASRRIRDSDFSASHIELGDYKNLMKLNSFQKAK